MHFEFSIARAMCHVGSEKKEMHNLPERVDLKRIRKR